MYKLLIFQVVNSLLWRKQHNVDKILHEFEPPPVLVKYFPGSWHHNDKEGRPLFILRLGQMDIKVEIITFIKPFYVK